MSRAIESRRIGVSLAAAALTLALSGGTASAQSGKPWRHGVIEPKADAGFFMMAEKRGFFDKFGLKVETVKIKNDQIGLKAALAGELDSYEGGPGGAIVADSRGVDVRVIGCLWLTVPHGIFVHDNVNAMQELKGKTIAISAPGSFPEILARGALAKYNVPADQVKFATVGGDLDRYKALVAKVVDAAVVSGEYLPVAEKEHIKMLVSGSEALPDFVRTCIQATEARLTERPDDAARFLAAQMAASALRGRAQGRGGQGRPGGDRHQAGRSAAGIHLRSRHEAAGDRRRSADSHGQDDLAAERAPPSRQDQAGDGRQQAGRRKAARSGAGLAEEGEVRRRSSGSSIGRVYG